MRPGGARSLVRLLSNLKPTAEAAVTDENHARVREFVWASLRETLKASPANRTILVTGPSNRNIAELDRQSAVGTIEGKVYWKCSDAGLPIDAGENLHIRRAVLEVLFEALADGLIVPIRWKSAATTPKEMFRFDLAAFTMRGAEWFSGQVPLWDGSDLASYLRGLNQLAPVEVELLLEAQSCLKSGCNRAAAVMVGLAVESACETLIDTVATGPQSPSTKEWKDVGRQTAGLAVKWTAATAVLEALRTALTPAPGTPYPTWFREVWQHMPQSVLACLVGIRDARNVAAHDGSRQFGRHEVACLLYGTPSAIISLRAVEGFLKSPPAGVNVPPV